MERNQNSKINKTRSERIKKLEEQIADLKKQWPAHSVPPAMMQRLDELEEELERELSLAKKN